MEYKEVSGAAVDDLVHSEDYRKITPRRQLSVCTARNVEFEIKYKVKHTGLFLPSFSDISLAILNDTLAYILLLISLLLSSQSIDSLNLSAIPPSNSTERRNDSPPPRRFCAPLH